MQFLLYIYVDYFFLIDENTLHALTWQLSNE